MSIWDLIIGFITDYIPINGLLIIQIAISSIIVLVTLLIISLILFCLPYFWFSLCYILSFFFTGGGIWFCRYFKNHYFYEMPCCKCCNKKNIITDKCHKKIYQLLGEKNVEKLKIISKKLNS